MLNRAIASLILIAAACAAAAVAVLAGAFALYALIEPLAGAVGAAGAVALGASMSVGACALLVAHRAGKRARKAEVAQRAMMNQLQILAGGIAQKHPVAAMLAAVVGGVLAARSPRVVDEFLAVAAHLGKSTSSP